MSAIYKYFSADQAGMFDEGQHLCTLSDNKLPADLPKVGDIVSLELNSKDVNFTNKASGVVTRVEEFNDEIYHISVKIGAKA